MTLRAAPQLLIQRKVKQADGLVFSAAAAHRIKAPDADGRREAAAYLAVFGRWLRQGEPLGARVMRAEILPTTA